MSTRGKGRRKSEAFLPLEAFMTGCDATFNHVHIGKELIGQIVIMGGGILLDVSERVHMAHVICSKFQIEFNNVTSSFALYSPSTRRGE